MPTIVQSDLAKGRGHIPYPVNAGAVAAQTATVAVPASTADDDIFEVCCLPERCVIVDAILFMTDLEGSAGDELVIAGGIMSGVFGVADGTRTVGAELWTGLTTGQAGGIARPTLYTAFTIAASNADRGVGVEFTTDPETDAAGTLGMTLFYVSAA